MSGNTHDKPGAHTATGKARLGMRIFLQTADTPNEIVENIQKTSETLADVAMQTEDTSAATAQINETMDQVALAAQQNSATSQQSAAASDQMKGRRNFCGI